MIRTELKAKPALKTGLRYELAKLGRGKLYP